MGDHLADGLGRGGHYADMLGAIAWKVNARWHSCSHTGRNLSAADDQMPELERQGYSPPRHANSSLICLCVRESEDFANSCSLLMVHPWLRIKMVEGREAYGKGKEGT